MTTREEAERIAARSDVRNALSQYPVGRNWAFKGDFEGFRLFVSMISLGIFKTISNGMYCLTPLGLAVRGALLKESAHDL